MTAAPTTVYLFAGDSLTEGVYGEGYVERVAKALYQGQGELSGEVVNAGRGCDTVKSLLDRIEGPLHRHQPQWVILAIGTNDVWLPWLSSHSLGWWLWFSYRRIVLGQAATTDLDRFAAAYRALIDKARTLARARVLACTVSPIGEQLASPVNRQLARLNGVIKHVAADCRVPVADVWQAFVEELATLPRPSGYAPGEWLFAYLDRRRLQDATPDELSRRRRLHLTFDGLHLNSEGAALWAHTIVTALAQAQGTTAASRPGSARHLGLRCFEHGSLQVCCTPGWEVRAHDLGHLLAGAYQHLASLTGAHPAVDLAVLNRVHWNQLAEPLPYPAPGARWDGESGTVFVPEAYTIPFLRDLCLPQTLAAWTAWPPALSEVGEPARATALADLLALEELAHIFLRELQVAPADPALRRLLAGYLVQVVLRARKAPGAARMAALWDAWGEVMARFGIAEGQMRLQAKKLYEMHGDGLTTSLANRPSSIREQVAASPVAIAPELLSPS